MRFLNTSTLQFEQIPDSEIHLEKNQYAILSHRWGADEDEISFQDVHLSTDLSRKKGFDKIQGFCKKASLANCRYGWVDTCCINKGNPNDPNELSEAINSMYQLYQGSKICIAYLKDVPQKQLIDSEWFNRGWTLQELIAPKAVTFFDHDWNIIGTRVDLIADLSRKTRIPEGILSHATEPYTYSIAQRMSWAANRVTTRVEDRAYSLMGLFKIKMPLIYGEREEAFTRLQQEIIKKSMDESIFAWDMDLSSPAGTYSGPFAPSPLAYAKCSDIVSTQGSRGFAESNGELSLWPNSCQLGPETYLAALQCTDRAYPDSKKFILVARTSTENVYVRVRKAEIVSQGLIQKGEWTRLEKRQIRVLVDPTEPPLNIFNGFWLRTLQPPGYDRAQTTILSNSQTSEADHVFKQEYSHGVIGIVRMGSPKGSDIQWITFSFDEDANPVLRLAKGIQFDYDFWFRQAVAHGIESREHQQLMKTSKKMSGICLVVKVDRKQGNHLGLIHEKLNLKIRLQLQPRHSPTKDSTGDINDSGLSLNPMQIWVVDITAAKEAPPHTTLSSSLARWWKRVYESASKGRVGNRSE